MSRGGQLTADKIRELGRATESRADLLLQAYLSELSIEDSQSTKHYRVLRDCGVIQEGLDSITLSKEMRRLFDIMAKKSHRLHVMPDIEEWKRNIEHYSKLALNASYEVDEASHEQGYLDTIEDYSYELADALIQEMASIEFTINSELNNTFNLKSKRIILDTLTQKIKSQIEKVQSLSREELHKCHAGNYKVSMILDNLLFGTIDQCIKELTISLDKTVVLIDKLKKEQTRQNERLWRLHRHIRNGQYNPKDVVLSFDDLVAHNLAFGGMAVETQLTNVDVEEDKFLLLGLLDKMSPPKRTLKDSVSNHYDDPLLHVDDDNTSKPRLSAEQRWAYDFMKYNNTNDINKNLSVRQFWERFEVNRIIKFKSFLALVMHICKSNFRDDAIVHTKEGYQWKLYLKTKTPSELCNTIRIFDARYIRYKVADNEPSLDKVWR